MNPLTPSFGSDDGIAATVCPRCGRRYTGTACPRHNTTGQARSAATTESREERLRWIRAWAEGWKVDLDNRPADHYYANLPLDVACDMILELLDAT